MQQLQKFTLNGAFFLTPREFPKWKLFFSEMKIG